MASFDTGDIPMTSPVQCSPSAGPMTPCDSLLPSTPIRVFWWTAVVLSFLLNGIIMLSCAIRFCARRMWRRPTAVPSDEEMLRRIDSDSRFSSENRVALQDSDVTSSHYCLNIGRNETVLSDGESFHASLCHLTLADIFVTVYTAIVLSYDHSTRGEFAVHGARWQQSPLCHSAGFFLTFGTQLAFGTICVLAVERYLAIMHPHQTARHMRKNMLIVAFTSIWVISIATGIVTLFGGIEYKDDDSSVNTLPAKRGATCLPWTTEFIYVIIMVTVHVIICVVTCVLCSLMLCRKSKQSWLITRRGTRTQTALTVAVNILFILPLALLAVFISGYMTFSDFASSYDGGYAAQEDGNVLFDMGSILSFAMFAIPFRPLLNPILFLIFNKPLRKDIAYVVKNALFTNPSNNRTFHQSHSSILEPMFDSDMNSVVQSGSSVNYPIINRIYNGEEIMRPSLAYDNRGIASSSSVSYHAPSLSVATSNSRQDGGQSLSSERKRRKRYTRSQRSERLATDTDPNTESEVITFHKGGHAVYYNPDARERWRKKLSVRYGGISARDEFQSLVFPRHHRASSSDQGTNSTVYPVMPSTLSALTRSACVRHPSINESSKNLSCDADASDVSSVDYSSAKYQYQTEPSNIKAQYNSCEQPIMMADLRKEYSCDSDAYDADKEIALITSFMMTDCKTEKSVFEDSDTVKRLHCDLPRNPTDCTRSCNNQTKYIAPSSGEIRNEKPLAYPSNAAFLRQSSHSSTNNDEGRLIEKLGNSCEYCDSSTSKDSGIHSEIDSTSGASYSDTSMGRRLHYSAGNSAVKSLADSSVSRSYDISSYTRDIGVISSMDNTDTITLSPSTNSETISRDASSNTLT